MVVYGRNPVREALRGRRGRQLGGLWATPAALREEWVRAASAEPVADDAAIERRCRSGDHQGVCAEVGDYPYVEPEAVLEPPEALAICLDEVQDPHNLGAVCRVAECAGASGVVLPERRASAVTPAVCKASAGAVEHLPVARVRNVAEFLDAAKRSEAWVYGAAGGAEVGYEAPDYRGRVVLVLGSEGRGIRPRVAAACDELVALPVRGRVGSLNVSTAAAALVYGILRLRDGGP